MRLGPSSLSKNEEVTLAARLINSLVLPSAVLLASSSFAHQRIIQSSTLFSSFSYRKSPAIAKNADDIRKRTPTTMHTRNLGLLLPSNSILVDRETGRSSMPGAGCPIHGSFIAMSGVV